MGLRTADNAIILATILMCLPPQSTSNLVYLREKLCIWFHLSNDLSSVMNLELYNWGFSVQAELQDNLRTSLVPEIREAYGWLPSYNCGLSGAWRCIIKNSPRVLVKEGGHRIFRGGHRIFRGDESFTSLRYSQLR